MAKTSFAQVSLRGRKSKIVVFRQPCSHDLGSTYTLVAMFRWKSRRKSRYRRVKAFFIIKFFFEGLVMASGN